MPKKEIFEPDTNRFFVERWNEKVHDEGGQIRQHMHTEKSDKKNKTDDHVEKETVGENEFENNQAIEIFSEIVEGVDDDEVLKPLLSDLEKAIVHYAASIVRYNQSRKEMVTGKEMAEKEKEDADKARRLAHNSLVSALSILSRSYVKKFGTCMWRYKIDEGRGDRDRIAGWVKKVAPFVSDKLNQY